ncbi:hypothetical protein [Haloarcula sp. Atlit-7R]|uniref:hypothetical protein n=1 Tax=Haloarcula sp. Atlit-7R TaxID=2282125 RepID=UPI000EF13A25|nr:hypothetical protein [Haloarcula sp. Atlit-7R]RLM94348.1 hypothetical protein D3D01_15920 [Haloarcula sp. Atlit-7R]
MTRSNKNRCKTTDKETVQSMLTDSELSQLHSQRYFSGDGTWTEAHVIVAIVDGATDDIALSKAAAAFKNREDRPDPLFAHDKEDTYDLAIGLQSLPLAISESPWSARDAIIQLGTDEAEEALDLIVSDSTFAEGESIAYNEWGEQFTSEAALRNQAASIEDNGWIVVGVGLKPTGAGEGNEEYIGETFNVHCPSCGPKPAQCKNIVYEERHDGHSGIWECSNCSDIFRGPHPRGPARQELITDK